MKILLDECLPVDFRREFAGHEAHTAEWVGLKGKQNGQLLKELDRLGYDVLITVDKGIPSQSNLTGRRFGVIVLVAATNQIEDLVPLVGAIHAALEDLEPGTAVVIP